MTAPTAGLVVIPAEALVELVQGAVASALAERTAPAPEPLLLTCSALCRRLGMSRASVFRWRREGMPSIRAGDEHRYVLDEVMAWLRGRS